MSTNYSIYDNGDKILTEDTIAKNFKKRKPFIFYNKTVFFQND